MKKICLVAVDVRSTHNVGSFFRTADGFGAEIVLVGITPRPKGAENDERLPHIIDKAHKAIAKTALGAESSVKWRYFADITIAVEILKQEGFSIIAIEQATSSNNIANLNVQTPTALLMGAEVEGLPATTLDLCDYIYEIPMIGQKESFNVAVSAGIALYQTSLSS